MSGNSQSLHYIRRMFAQKRSRRPTHNSMQLNILCKRFSFNNHLANIQKSQPNNLVCNDQVKELNCSRDQFYLGYRCDGQSYFLAAIRSILNNLPVSIGYENKQIGSERKRKSFLTKNQLLQNISLVFDSRAVGLP
jgi:hypothetical protein